MTLVLTRNLKNNKDFKFIVSVYLINGRFVVTNKGTGQTFPMSTYSASTWDLYKVKNVDSMLIEKLKDNIRSIIDTEKHWIIESIYDLDEKEFISMDEYFKRADGLWFKEVSKWKNNENLHL